MVLEAYENDVDIDDGADEIDSVDELGATFQRETHLTSVEQWANTVAHTAERRNQFGDRHQRLNDRHSLGGIFKFEDKVNLSDAWNSIGGNRMGIATRPAESVLMDGKRVPIDGKLWIYPTLDGTEFNPTKPLEVVSNNRYEVIQPRHVIDMMTQHFKDSSGEPLPVAAIAFSGDMNSIVVQFERPEVELNIPAYGSVQNDLIRRFFTVHIPILGSVTAGAIDARWRCMNMMPSLLSKSFISIRHLNGANKNIVNEFSSIIQQLDFALVTQIEIYNTLAKMAAKPDDFDRVIQKVYPYSNLPEPYDQTTSPQVVTQLLNRQRAGELRGGEIPMSNRKIVESRVLAQKGYQDAVEEVGETLWALAQINYSANHHPTKSIQARSMDMAINGWRRRDALKTFAEVLHIGEERGARYSDDVNRILKTIK